jgi:hypothetical protein
LFVVGLVITVIILRFSEAWSLDTLTLFMLSFKFLEVNLQDFNSLNLQHCLFKKQVAIEFEVSYAPMVSSV